MDEKKKQAVKESIKAWLKEPSNLWLVVVVGFAFIIRLYYFNLTQNQPLWWDESDYLAFAKNIAGFPVEWVVTAKHNSIYPFLAGAIFAIGGSEAFAKFVLQFIPSILTVFFTYVTAKKMYGDYRIGLIAAAILSVFWVHLFNTMRFHVDILGFFTGVLAIYVFWTGYERKEKLFGKIPSRWAIPLAVTLVLLTYMVRRGYFLFGLFFLVYMLITKNPKQLMRDKYNWIGLAIAIVGILIAETVIFVAGIGGVGGDYFQSENAINFLPLQLFGSQERGFFIMNGGLAFNGLFFAFWIGAIIALANAVISFPVIRKKAAGIARSDVFNLLAIIITLGFFIYVLRIQGSFGETRWYLPLAFAAFVCVGRGLVTIANQLKPYHKYAGVVLIVLVVGLGMYHQVQVSDNIITSRVESFEGIRQAGLFLRENSDPNALIITTPLPQVAYYAERKVIQPKQMLGADTYEVPLEDVLQKIRETPEAQFMIVSFSEPNHPTWMKQVVTEGGRMRAWEIPFMDSRIDFATGEQTIMESKTYGDLTFQLLTVQKDVFVYGITRE